MSLSNWTPTGGPFDHPQMATVDLECFHCRRTTRVPMRRLHEKEAEHWRLRYERLLGQLNDAIKRCHAKYGTDPMERDLQAWLEKIRDDLDNGFWKGQVHS